MQTLFTESKFTYILGALSTANNDYLFTIQHVYCYVDFCHLIYFHVSLEFELLQTDTTVKNVFKSFNHTCQKN